MPSCVVENGENGEQTTDEVTSCSMFEDANGSFGDGDVSGVKTMERSNVNFVNEVYKVASKTEGNLLLSPCSVECLLMLASLGAEDETREAIYNALMVETSTEDTQNEVCSMLDSLKDIPYVVMKNKVYVVTDSETHKNFKEAAEKFHIDIEEIKLEVELKERQQLINDWITNTTKKSITEIVPEGGEDSLTSIILVGGSHFKGKWSLPFSKDLTYREPFFCTVDQMTYVDMMHQRGIFKYGEIDFLQSQLLELPYEEENLRMVILLPFEYHGLKELEENLPDVDLLSLLEQFQKKDVKVTIPKIKLEKCVDLKDTLLMMNMDSVFKEKEANFSQIQDELFVSAAIQKSVVEIDEGSDVSSKSFPLGGFSKTIAKSFTVDHPFLFFIIHLKTVIFVGRVMSIKD